MEEAEAELAAARKNADDLRELKKQIAKAKEEKEKLLMETNLKKKEQECIEEQLEYERQESWHLEEKARREREREARAEVDREEARVERKQNEQLERQVRAETREMMLKVRCTNSHSNFSIFQREETRRQREADRVREEERHKRERDELEAELARVAEAKREAECALDKEEQDRIRLEGQTMLEKANVAEGTRSSKRRSARNKNVELDTKTTNRSPDAKVSPRPTNTVKNEYGEVMTTD